jgi:Holliday junction resolvase RusA-like endonuclease
MTELTRDYAVRVYGLPTPQGSMTCKAKHVTRSNLQPGNEADLKPWRALVEKAGRALPVSGLVGPVGVEVTLTVARPKTVTRDWPCQKANRRGVGGDIDKLARAVLDALESSGVIGNDAQVVELIARKCYPTTPGAQDRLDRPGAVIRIYPIGG